MIKKIIHLADIHVRTYKMHDEYKQSFTHTLESIKDKVINYNREEVRIVIVGDIVHQKITISNEQLLLCSWFIDELAKIAPVVIIAGNHDLLENNSDRMDSITPIVAMCKENDITYYKESKCYLDDNIVWCVYSIFEHNKIPNILSGRKELGDDKKYVALYHAPINGVVTDIGYTINHENELDIFDGCDMGMLGDIHKHQTFERDNKKIAYSSSLIQQNYGETVNNHGFLMWDVENRDFEFCEVKNDTPFYQFKINDVDNEFDELNEVWVNK